MARRNHVIVFFIALGLIFFAPFQAKADPLSIAIVDVDRILAASKAGQSLQTQLQAKKESFQKEFAGKEKQLKESESQLIAEREKLKPEEFAVKRKAYEESVMETRRLFQKSRNGLDQGVNKAMNELRKSLMEATSEVADEKGYDVVLARESVIIAEKTLDITDAVLAKMNAKLPSITLSVE